MKNCAKIVLILQCCNSALLGRFVFKNHTYVPKLIYFQSLLEVFAQDVISGGCLSKYRRAFIVYMFRQPPEVWSLVSDSASISGTGKASMKCQLKATTSMVGGRRKAEVHYRYTGGRDSSIFNLCIFR